MPKQRRWSKKRDLDAAIADLDRAGDHIAICAHGYEDDHPDYYAGFCVILRAIEMVKSRVTEMRDLI
jgi:hypothetical protein